MLKKKFAEFAEMKFCYVFRKLRKEERRITTLSQRKNLRWTAEQDNQVSLLITKKNVQMFYCKALQNIDLFCILFFLIKISM